MGLEVTCETLIDRLKHDGSAIWHPDKRPPQNRRGFSPFEFLPLCRAFGYLPEMYFRTWPQGNDSVDCHEVALRPELWAICMGQRCVFMGTNHRGVGHAVLISGAEVYDPSVGIYPLSDMMTSPTLALLPLMVVNLNWIVPNGSAD